MTQKEKREQKRIIADTCEISSCAVSMTQKEKREQKREYMMLRCTKWISLNDSKGEERTET